MRFRYCIFDIDGTIVDTERTGVLSLIATVRDLMGREMSYEEAYPYFGIPSAKVGGMLGYPDEAHFWNEWEHRFMELRHLMVPFDGILDVISDLKAAGAVIGVVTSRSRKEMDLDPDAGVLLKDVGFSVCAGETAHSKPHPDPLLRFFELAGVPREEVSPENCVYIGDMVHDCSCAHAAGVSFILADWHRRGLQGIPAEHSFSDSEGLKGLLMI